MKFINRKSQSGIKIFAIVCLAASFGTGVFAAQPVTSGEGRIGGYSIEDKSMAGHYGDANDEFVAVSRVEVGNAKASPENKPKMTKKKDSRLGAFSAEDKAMLGRYGDQDDGS
ncbi:MAG: hypothetical protein L0Z73_01355 [Gammaproteobacteria bacterium]|nr:hypothetical protein [Gammaproteobacteria bacterium]